MALPGAAISTAQAIQRGLITGVGQGALVERLDLDDFMVGADGDMRMNLFLLAMEALQADQGFTTSWFSYFNIAGIHGLPTVIWNGISNQALYNFLNVNGRWRREAWDNVAGGRAQAGDSWKGYCTHNSIQFPTWHRYAALCAMMEQAAQAKMLEIANLFTDAPYRAEALRVAAEFRFPYWNIFKPRGDPAAPTVGLPHILGVRNVRVRRPGLAEDNLVTIENPLYTYHYPTQAQFGALSAGGNAWSLFHSYMNTNSPRYQLTAPYPGLLQTDMTIRYPDAATNLLSSNQNLQNRILGAVPVATDPLGRAGYIVLAEKLWRVMAGPVTDPGGVDYRRFASTSWRMNVRAGNRLPFAALAPDPYSIEGFHNTMHAWCGGTSPAPVVSGTMTDNTYAAFDPIFWQLHGYIERMFTLWQAMHRNVWWPPNTPGGVDNVGTVENTWTSREGTWEQPTTPLTPFQKSSSTQKWYQSMRRLYFWDSNDVRDHTIFNVSYPETNPTTGATSDIIEGNATRAVNIELGLPLGRILAATDLPLPPPPNLGNAQVFLPGAWPPVWDGAVIARPPDVVPIHPAPVVAPVVAPAPVPAPVVGGGGGGGGIVAAVAIPHHVALAEPTRLVREKTPSVSLRVVRSATAGGFKPKVASPGIVMKAVEGKEKPAPSSEASASANPTSPLSAQTPITNKSNLGDGSGIPRQDPMRPFQIPKECLIDGRKLNNWNFNFSAERQGLHTSFTVFVFVGDFPDDPLQWHSAPNLVLAAGHLTSTTLPPQMPDPQTQHDVSHATVPPPTGGCANCQAQAAARVRFADFVPLTLTLASFVGSRRAEPSIHFSQPNDPPLVLRSLDPVDVVPFLKRNLHWRVRLGNGTEVQRENVPGLKVWVTDEMETLPSHLREMSRYERGRMWTVITHGRISGMADDESWVEDNS